ncbi:MAG: thymidylate kinase [Burkholderiales bacterium]|nr:thymidylate kinase [Burkholderiales bacterium]
MSADDRGHVLQALFDFLESEKIDYCVMGDTGGYPYRIPSDVDIVVSPQAFAGIGRTVARFCRAYDASPVQMIRHEQTAIYFVLAWYAQCGALRFLAVDFCSDYFRQGRRLLTARDILEGRERPPDESGSAGRFYVPRPAVRFIYYLVKKIGKGELGDAHANYLSAQWHDDVYGAAEWVSRFWPATRDAELLTHAAAMNEWMEVVRAIPGLQRALRRGHPRSLKWVLAEWRRRLVRVLHPTGMVVAFLGADGSGKSSVIERALAELQPVFRRIRYVHLRPRVMGFGLTQSLPVARPHALPARGKLVSLVKLAWLLLDYVVGYASRVRPLACRSTLVAFDRYFHDLLVDPRRYRYGGPRLLVQWLARCVPAPDMWVLLDAPGTVLQSRKSEVSLAESERQRTAYQRFVESCRNTVTVDASRALDEVVSDVVAAILDVLVQRLETRSPELQVERNPLRARLLVFFCRHRVPVLSKLLRILFNSDIYCAIRSPILMPHPYGIVIHSKAVIGRRVTIMQQVTIGGKDPIGENTAPIIEDDVYVGAGARIIGNVRVGKSTIVGANAVVTRDVPPYSTVVGANRVTAGGMPFHAAARVAMRAQQDELLQERLSA